MPPELASSARNSHDVEISRRAGCSFAAAWQVVQDFTLLRTSERAESKM